MNPDFIGGQTLQRNVDTCIHSFIQYASSAYYVQTLF